MFFFLLHILEIHTATPEEYYNMIIMQKKKRKKVDYVPSAV